jgi:hypothetical protein
VQFTCGFKDVPLAGRADFKAIKTMISKVAPVRVVALRGREADCLAVASYAKSCGIEV